MRGATSFPVANDWQRFKESQKKKLLNDIGQRYQNNNNNNKKITIGSWKSWEKFCLP